jgi:hypothetical protein
MKLVRAVVIVAVLIALFKAAGLEVIFDYIPFELVTR